MRRVAILVLIGLVCCVGAAPARAQVHIEDLRVGFGLPTDGNEGNYKIGNWAPARVRLRAEQDGFSGYLEISSSDSDDIEAAVTRRVTLSPSETLDFATLVKPGKQMPDFHVRVLDESGRLRDRALFDTSGGRAWDGGLASTTLIVALGRPAGLDVDEFAKRPGYPRESYRIGQLETSRELPGRWYGYEAVDHLVLCMDDPLQAENMDVAVRAGLETWVRQGGHLVVSVGTAWERVLSVLGPLLPAEIDRVDTVRQLGELESYLGQGAPAIRMRDPLSVPHLANVRGQIVAGTREVPLVVRGPLGMGMVTFVAIELNREPFASWEGRTDFWIKLLSLRKEVGSDRQPGGAWVQRAMTDMSSHLRLQLEHFEGVALVPFQWVAFFIFLYILLIGPVDYFLVKRVFKRMELTWITFPLIVVGVSLGAYGTAYWLKGDELRVNKIDLVDVDQSSGLMRGTSWFTLFSPQIKNYSIRVQPSLAVGAEAPSLQAGPPVVLSWLGLAEDAIGGMARQSGMGLFRRGYRFGPDAQTLEAVPIQVWSMKGFTARWQGAAAAPVESDLQAIDANHIKGTLTNRLAAALEEGVLVYGRKVYPIGNIPVNGSVVFERRSMEDLSGHLTRRAAQYASSGSPRGYRVQQAASFAPGDLLFTMMFHRKLPEGGQYADNAYFGDVDLSDHLDHARAILVARVAGDGSRLFLNDVEVVEGAKRVSYLRVLLPVANEASE